GYRIDFLARQIRIDLVWVGENTEENEQSLRYIATRALNPDKLNLLTKEIGAAVALLKDPESIKIKDEYLNEIQVILVKDFTNQQDFATRFKLNSDTIDRFLKGEPIHYKEFITMCNALELDDRKIEEIHQPVYSDLELEVRSDAREYGFQVSRSDLLKLLEVPASESFANDPPDTTPKIGKNIPKLRTELAEELKKYSLPSQRGALVVVTGFKERETFARSGVWRSLSKLIETEEDSWEDVPVLSNEDRGDYIRTLFPMPFSLFKLVTEAIQKVWDDIADRLKSSSDRDLNKNDDNPTRRS
ncbi:hypothetical protein VB714_00275, partial [Spirulina sp. 06S082]